jgi:hypothetical protein
MIIYKIEKDNRNFWTTIRPSSENDGTLVEQRTFVPNFEFLFGMQSENLIKIVAELVMLGNKFLEGGKKI